MKATVAILAAPKKVEFIEQELPLVGDGGMLIRMDAVGLCHSDLPAYCGSGVISVSRYGYREPEPAKYPFVAGHEPVATVLETGKNVKKFKAGDKISGRVFQCFRTHMVIPEADHFTNTAALFKLPEMPGRDYRCCLAEILDCVVNIVKSIAPVFGDNVAVIGCGVMGLLSIAGLRKSGVKRLVAIDVLDKKLTLAKTFGATDGWNPAKIENLSEYAFERTAGQFFDVVVEISGSIRGLDTALQIVKFSHENGHANRPFLGHGRVLIPSVYTKEETFPVRLALNMIARTPTLHPVHPNYSIDPMHNEVEGIEAFVNGTLPLEQLITHRVKFEDLQTGMEWLVTPPEGFIKGLCLFD
ncbi:MAG: alcohol dehydrogenase catalytic domain-containing protein [Planctomycetota bacterium]|jgi:threonine dehydrogenase-like Zn-dependent dehydrogenase|nr:alcohol dehydrogenase catalytic domain-containing protein [Planctomycetota bacterium]